MAFFVIIEVMIKQEAIEALEQVLFKQYKESQKVFDKARSGAISAEGKQESKYDTRALEESYLAHGLANKVIEDEEAIEALNACRLSQNGGEIGLGSFIHCVNPSNEDLYFLICRKGGGVVAQVGAEEVTIITLESPIAKQFLNARVGDSLLRPSFQIKFVG